MPSIPRTPLQLALRARADTLRSIDVAKARITTLEERVSALDAEIAALGGRLIPEARPRLPFRANGEMQRALFDLLRERETATSADLALVMLKAKGLDASDLKSAEAYAMRQRCIQAFRRCERAGLAKHVSGVGRRGRFKVWSFAD